MTVPFLLGHIALSVRKLPQRDINRDKFNFGLQLIQEPSTFKEPLCHFTSFLLKFDHSLRESWDFYHIRRPDEY